MSHYAANFLIFAATGLNFRTELRAVLRRSCLVTCLRRACCRACATGTGNRSTDSDADVAMLEMQQANATPPIRNGGRRPVSDAVEANDLKRSDDVMMTSPP